MYTGINSEGINREVVATLECASLNKHNKKMSLAIPKTAILHIAKTLESNLLPGRSSADEEKIRGILPALRHMVDLDSQVLPAQKGVIRSTIPIASEDLESTELDPYAGSYFCKLCYNELFNSFMHCNGCESLLGKDFDLCIQCHQEGTFERFHRMNPSTEDDNVSTMNHTGEMACTCSCKRKSNCSKCKKCPHCCKCHTEFTHKWRFYTGDGLREILRVLEEAVEGSELQYSEETQVRLKLIADREDVEALEAKRNILDRDFASPPPQDEDLPARKKGRLEGPLPTTTDEAARKTPSPYVSLGLSPPAADGDIDDANNMNADPMADKRLRLKSQKRSKLDDDDDDNSNSNDDDDQQPNLESEATEDTPAKVAEAVPTGVPAPANATRAGASDDSENNMLRLFSMMLPAGRCATVEVGDGNSRIVHGDVGVVNPQDILRAIGALSTSAGTADDIDYNFAEFSAYVLKQKSVNEKKSAKEKTEKDAEDEDIPARKKPRLETPVATTKDEAATKTAPPDVAMAPSPPPPAPADIDDNDDADADPESDTQSKPRAKKRDWTSEEDAKLTSAVANTPKKNWGEKDRADWVGISELVPGRSRKHCWHRWNEVLNRNIDQALPRRTGKWEEDEDSKLRDALQIHGSTNWGAVAALVPGRTNSQCWHRWHQVLDPSIDRASGRKGKWSEDEDSKLKDAVQTHGGKNWAAIAALVPSRTHTQCNTRWRNVLESTIDQANERSGR
jgi:hypothetical protein